MTLLARLLAPFAPLIALFGSGCAAAPAATEARPALWQVADADTRIYLFGTVHLLPEDVTWRTPAFDRAFAEADTLVLEVDMPTDPQAQASRYAALATSPGLPPLIERVPPADRPALARMIAESRIPEASLNALETWAAALALGTTLYRESGLTPAAGVEQVLKGAAGGKRIVGLETLEQQLGFFDTLPESAQRDLLRGLLQEAEGADGAFDAMIAAWTAGDLRRLAETYQDAEGLSPEVADALLARRNAAWTEWVKQRLDTPGTVMVAVGAGHLAGDGSVIQRLEQQGLRVRRVQ
ncbi:hypothetical protein GGR88_000319 [Sphingomonas jejuensis]|uniref:TraB/GumN family protein n=1 Tax=Sphingomonas jejuensis TaxID=904715 RepID=A0ABX0XHZ1_9SPHN|nr:TraB/GumN family protein [Sphingomonas jejuensis]NJC32845.1 hypothetical protein [Sphingomonas jejuensis]